MHLRKSFLTNIFFLGIALFFSSSYAQPLTQSIRGKIIDKESKSTIVGATIILVRDTGRLTGAISDMDGNFRIANVPLGRRTLTVKLMGYQELTIPNIVVDAGKEIILTIELEESVITANEVTITAKKKEDVNNEMAIVSSRSFSVDETNRYAGSRSDPARMASNFAGVQGADDSRNDIVIRGNSPMGLLWRIEGVDVPNPNHFAIAGTAGGAISILNNKVFANSDFFTGAFPAEYGNANAGVFDIKFRNGNNEKHEFTGQLGFLGTELAAEGPLYKSKGSTYLATYRYSTLKIFESLNIKIGTTAVPNYQDASFKINFPTKKQGNISLFGIGGTSKIDILLSQNSPDEVELYGQNDRDQTFSTSMGLIGATHSKSIDEKTYIKTTLSTYLSNAYAKHNLFYRDSATLAVDTLFPKLRYEFNTYKTSINSSLTKKITSRHTLKTGIIAEWIGVDYADSNYIESIGKWDNRLDHVGSTYLIQPFVQWKYKQTDNLVFNAGIHALYFGLNGSYALEPRAGLKWNFKSNQSLNFGYGMHSQLLPLYIYFHHQERSDGSFIMHNKNLDLTRSMHWIGGYDNNLSATMRLKVETYYQYLYNIPVDNFPSSFSLINQGSQFSRFFPNSLENSGTGFNYGGEVTLEKFFSKSYFFMITGSYYESKYKGKDGVLRNTDFNGNYTLNGLITKEWPINKEKTKVITTGTKITWAGGKRYSPADIELSRYAGELIDADAFKNSLQFRDYFRADVKLGIKINTRNIMHELAFDLVNILNTKNILGLTYAPDPSNPSANPIREEYQLGFLPLFYYKIDF